MPIGARRHEHAGMIILERFCNGPAGIGTFGMLTAGKFRCFTVEREWAANAPFNSCLPAGDYRLEPFVSPRYGPTFALANDARRVTVAQTPFSHRWLCIFHPANRAAELAGCIAPGAGLGLVGGQWAVTDSAAMFRALLPAIAQATERMIRIRYRPCPEDTQAPAAPAPVRFDA